MEHILTKLSESGVASAPCPRFKEWTHDHRGSEFILRVIIPSAPMKIAFGPSNYEREPIQMVSCITADMLYDKYALTATAGKVNQPARHWWLLVTANRVSDLVTPTACTAVLEISAQLQHLI